MSQKSITIRESADIKIVDVNEDLVGHILTDFRETLVELARQKPKQIIVNLNQVRHINSFAIGAIVGVAKRVRQQDGDVKVYGLTDHIKGIFDLIGTSQVIDVYDSESAAIDAFKAV